MHRTGCAARTGQHWALVGALADRGVRVGVPLHGLTPRHTHREAYPLVTEVYRELLDHVPAAAVTLAGDSADAGLALGVARELPAAGLPQPRRIALISPWLDLTLSHPAVRAVAPHEPWSAPEGLVEMGRARAGGDDPADAGPDADVMVIDVTVMDGDWRRDVRKEVIERVLAALADACGLPEPSPAWWVAFRVIDEGSWGSRGTVLSVLSLLETGVFTEEKADAVRTALRA